MKFRERLIKNWKKEFRRKSFKFAYEQGRFDERVENNIKETSN